MMKPACRFDFAAALQAFALAAGVVLCCSLPAHARVANVPPVPAAVVIDENGGPGSAANPILLPTTEASATRRIPLPARGPLEFVLGPLQVSLYGTPGRVLVAGGGASAPANAYRTCSSNVYVGAGLGVALPLAGGLYVDGGRVTLGDPLDVLGRSGPGGEYWSTTAGVEIRF
jgi:hypothetical protein